MTMSSGRALWAMGSIQSPSFFVAPAIRVATTEKESLILTLAVAMIDPP